MRCYNNGENGIPLTVNPNKFQEDDTLPKTNYQYEKRQKELDKKKKKAEKKRLKEERKNPKPVETPSLSSGKEDPAVEKKE